MCAASRAACRISVGRIPQHFIDELIARADIVEVIGSRVQLKKAGREYKACCPFHNEKTPSFWVSPDKQFYHCFGCGKHGTALGFLMDHDHLAFPEAVEELAGRLGLEVPREGAPEGGAPRADEQLYDLMARVARFYVEGLGREARARDYLAKRGLSAATLERFQIGYAPNSWNEVLKRFGADDAQRRRLSESSMPFTGSALSDSIRACTRKRRRRSSTVGPYSSRMYLSPA